MSKAINVIFPHQLFEKSPLLENGHGIYLIEEYLFFKQYKFHKQKIAFHRASMKAYHSYLESNGKEVVYIESSDKHSDIRKFEARIKKDNISDIHVIDPTDEWLEKRLKNLKVKGEIRFYNNPQFINSKEELSSFFKKDKKSFFQTSFYKQQRKKLGILMEADDKPAGGSWTYDKENRKKYPKGKIPPPVHFPSDSKFWIEAIGYTEKHFKSNPGEIAKNRIYPINFKESRQWLKQFLEYRFFDFGIYEDAIVREHSILNHSLLSPLLNIGLLLPKVVVDESVKFAEAEKIPINSTEGFVRQIIGWREFIRGMYECKGNYSRTKNFWNFTRKIPKSFYDGTTGIEPIDVTIKKVLETGYCHHIERLMVLGNFMLLCEFDPDEVYRWFMELFIDAFDWVMVPNVYGMSQFSDGGTFATKPYIGGSNYVKKMSNYKKGPWCETWDGLFWAFMHKHQEFFLSNPRISMLAHTLKRMPSEKLQGHLENAEKFKMRVLDA